MILGPTLAILYAVVSFNFRKDSRPMENGAEQEGERICQASGFSGAYGWAGAR